jgi:LysR family transcriptional regulator, chromosome initiation inhibitor
MAPYSMAKAYMQRGELVELVRGQPLAVDLYWQYWRLDSPLLRALTQAVKTAAAKALV